MPQSFIAAETCKKCGLCSEVCPNKIIKKNETNEMFFRPDRADLCFKCGQCMAFCTTKSIIIEGLSYSKDFFDLPKQESFEEGFFNLIHSRRAIRNFSDKPVPIEALKKVVEAISFAPPGFPPIKTELIVVQNQQLIKDALPYMIELFEFLLKAMKNPIMRIFIKNEVGKKRFATMQQHLIPLMVKRLPSLKNGSEDTITRNAPAMILFLANRNAEDIREDIHIAATFGLLAAHAMGLGGSIMDIIPPAIEKKKELRKMFAVADNQEVVASIILGYPKYRYQRGIRREIKNVKWL
jgi:NAD-dependent dihydropyrimidine dehydrogenase PreA subunit/nitroreductase